MSARMLAGLAGLGSALLLAGALGFQHLGGLAPCPMCIWQRWPHAVAVALALLALAMPRAWLMLGGAAAALTTAGIGVFHAGVERGWWEGPSTCTAGPVDGLSADELLGQILDAPLVRCDEIVWELAGLSMAGWNAAVSLGLAALWLAALRRQLSSSASQ